MRGKKGRNYISRQACFVNCFTIYIFTKRSETFQKLACRRAGTILEVLPNKCVPESCLVYKSA